MAKRPDPLKGRAPFSRLQQKYIFALASKGVPWAVKKVKDDRTMRVQPKGSPAPRPLKKYDASKAKVVAKGKKVRQRA